MATETLHLSILGMTCKNCARTVELTLASTPGVTVRRGVAVKGLLTSEPTSDGIPQVVGVVTDAGEEIRADLVVDAAGRRSSLPALLADIGARPPVEELEDSGFMYYGRYYRSPDGTLPFSFGPPLQPYDSISVLTLPADNGTWGMGVVTSAADAKTPVSVRTTRFFIPY